MSKKQEQKSDASWSCIQNSSSTLPEAGFIYRTPAVLHKIIQSLFILYDYPYEIFLLLVVKNVRIYFLSTVKKTVKSFDLCLQLSRTQR